MDSKTIRLPKLKDVRIKLHRQLPPNALIKSATISHTDFAEKVIRKKDKYKTPVKDYEHFIAIEYGYACCRLNQNDVGQDEYAKGQEILRRVVCPDPESCNQEEQSPKIRSMSPIRNRIIHYSKVES